VQLHEVKLPISLAEFRCGQRYRVNDLPHVIVN
jgi:hypothetical protein